MKKAKLIALSLMVCVLLCTIAGCTPNTADDGVAVTPDAGSAVPSDASVTVTDMYGRQITLTEPAERVVALSAADCEILYALGAGDIIIGRGEYCDYPPAVTEIPAVQSGYETNIEQIIALRPQAVFMSSMDQSAEQVAALEDAGIHVIVSDADDIAGTYTAIEMIGAVIGKSEEAAVLISDMKQAFSEFEAKAAGDGSKSVYFEVSPLEWGLWTAGSDTFMNEIAAILGVKNCFGDVSGWAEISEEQVLERNPDYIVTITMYYGEGPTPAEEILGRAGWENVTAVKNGAILNLTGNELSRPAPRLVDGAGLLFDFIFGGQEQ